MHSENTAIIERQRRHWTAEQKRSVLEEAAATNVSATARKHNLATAQLFRWRREASGRRQHAHSASTDLGTSHKRLAILEEIATLVCALVLKDLHAGCLSSYKSACILGTLTNAITKISDMKLKFAECQAESSAKIDTLPKVSKQDSKLTHLAQELMKELLRRKEPIIESGETGA